MKQFSPLFLSIPFSVFLITATVEARLNTITGGITTGYDYDKTNYERDAAESSPLLNQETSQQQLSIGPLFIFETTSSTDGLTISYNPSYVYDFEDSQSDVDQSFSITAFRDFTRKLRIELGESFIYSDDPELLDAEISSDFNSGRRRYWTNNFNINSTYTYDTGSSFGAGYSFDILRNDDTGPGGYEDYDRHIVDLSLQHQINAAWNFSLFTNYTRGLFDLPEPILEEISPSITGTVTAEELSNDLSEYQFGSAINWILSSRKTLFVSYDFSVTDYDAILRDDTYLHNLTFGAQYQHTRRLSFELGAGPSYEKTETFDPNWGYNGHFNLNYDFAQYTSISAGVEKGYDQENFSANNNLLGRDSGLTEFWNFNVDISHQINADLTATLFGSYRDEKRENILHGFVNAIETDAALAPTDRETFREESRFTRKIYEAGGSLSYTFLQWYTASVSYTYRDQDSEHLNDSYDEHRFFLTLAFQKELLRW